MHYEKTRHGIEITYGGNTLEIEAFTPAIVHITCGAKKTKKRKSLCVAIEPDKINPELSDTKNQLIINTGLISLKIEKLSGDIEFYDYTGKRLLSEKKKSRKLESTTVSNEKCFRVSQGFARQVNEALYGLGQYEEGLFNYKECEVLLIQANRVIVNPFLTSTLGYGILWDNYSETVFNAADSFFSFRSEVGDGIDYYFVYGGNMDEVISQYRKLTGRAPMFPKWVFGYWQSKERYLDRNELVSIVKEYRRRKLPLDVIVQDWRYWGENEVFSGMIWQKHRFPDPRQMMSELHALGCRLMASVWPAFGPESQIHKEMKAQNFLFDYPHWTGSRVYDAFNEKARAIYWKHLKKCLFDNDVDAYWMDGTEAEFKSAEDRFVLAENYKANRNNALGTMARYLNAFSLMTTKGVYENQRIECDTKRVFILTRSAFAGQQRFGAAAWSGDTFAGWETLAAQVKGAINFSMSGLPYWTSDIGAFYTAFKYKEALSDPAYKELYIRWFQFVTFLPIHRAHGTMIPREIWRFGEEGSVHYDTQAKFIRLRYRLLPYVYSTAWKVTNEGYSFVRPLACDNPDDPKSRETGTQYMFGSSIMVCPVIKELYEDTKNKGDYIYYQNLFTPDGKEHGLIYEAFDGLTFKDLRVRRKLDTSSMGWSGNVPIGIEREYSQRWTGMVLTNEPGIYEFFAITDGSVRLWFDGKLVMDEWSNREEKRFSFSVKLKGNTKYAVKLDHQQFRVNQAVMRLNWHTPGMRKYEADKSLSVYLPPNAKWHDFWSGKSITGGVTLELEPALDSMPIYIPAGSIIPLGPEIQHTREVKSDPLEIRVYPGMDGAFELYEDEGDGYEYEKGACSITGFQWNDRLAMLSISERAGKYRGMPSSRTFNIVIVRNGHGAGLLETKRPDASVKYQGKEIIVRFKKTKRG